MNGVREPTMDPRKVTVLRKKTQATNYVPKLKRKNEFHGSSHLWHQQASQPYGLYRNEKNIISLFNLMRTFSWSAR